jgi:hypothetical protein
MGTILNTACTYCVPLVFIIVQIFEEWEGWIRVAQYRYVWG